MNVGRDLDQRLQRYIDDFIARNSAARILKVRLDAVGVGFLPVADHLTFRTDDIDRRATEFLELGYEFSERLEYQDWYAKVYRKAGYPPLFIDQAHTGDRGRTSIIPDWVARFGDRTLHHIAVRVESIDQAIDRFHCAVSVYCWNITILSPRKRYTWQKGALSGAPPFFMVPL